MISRPIHLPDDFSQIDDLFCACEVADAVDLNLHRDALQKSQATERFQIWLDDSEQVQGFARLYFNQVDGLIEGRYWYYVRPTATSQGIEASALQWAEQETRQQYVGGAGRLFTASRDDHLVRSGFLEANGFTRERYFFTMKMDLPTPAHAAEVPAGYTIRPAMLADIESYTELHNQAFREHWNSLPISVAASNDMRKHWQPMNRLSVLSRIMALLIVPKEGCSKISSGMRKH